MSTETTEKIVPRMGAEAGYGVEDTVAPLRVSGYVALILGLLSPAAVVGPAALLLPFGAIVFGLFALRRHGEQVPVGLNAAKIGLVLASCFGAAGIAIPWMKSATLGSQAHKFALDYIELVANNELEVAMELRKDYVNRFAADMPLKDHYALNEGAEDGIITFRTDAINDSIRRRGPGAEWKLLNAVRVFTHYGIQQAELILVDPTGSDPLKLYMVLEYRIDHNNGDGQWHMVRAQQYSEPIYAPSIL